MLKKVIKIIVVFDEDKNLRISLSIINECSIFWAGRIKYKIIISNSISALNNSTIKQKRKHPNYQML